MVAVSTESVFELAVRVLMDVPPDGEADGVYLYAQTSDNEESIFSAVPGLLARQAARKLLIADSPPRCGYPGIERWRRKLLEVNVSKEMILPVPTARHENLNTLTEAESVIELVRELSFRTLLITAHPIHQIRAFMTMVTVVERTMPELRLFSAPALPQPWTAEALHSQGVVRGRRHELLLSEFARIERYHAKGDLLSVGEVLAYLNRRDRHAG